MASTSNPDLNDAEDFKLSKRQAARRFGPPAQKDQIRQLIDQRIPVNTKKTTNWCMSVWKSWSEYRGITQSIETLSAEDLNNHLSNFIVEVNRQDGSPYPADTIYQLVAGIQRHLKENGRPELVILDPKNLDFVQTRQVLDARMKQLTTTGVGAVKKQVQPLTPEQEDLLWEQGIFSIETAQGLLNAVFWYNCKCFGLRGGDKHRSLQLDQYSLNHDECGRYLRFVGRSTKNYQGGLQHRKLHNKDLRLYSNPELGTRCVVDLFSEYLARIGEKSGPFYRRPVKNSDPPKFTKQVLGRNTLSTIVKRFCEEAGFQGNYTNHSGKVTCATTLFRSGVDEQLIMRQTGHRSDAVRAYKRSSKEQDVMVSSILQPPPQKKPFHFHNKENADLLGKAGSGEMDHASASTNSLGRNPVVGVTDVCSTSTTSLAGKPVAGVIENASTSTFLPAIHASHGHEMDSLSTRQPLVPLPLPTTDGKVSAQPSPFPYNNGVNISFCFYQK